MAQPIERFNELMEGVRADIAVKIFGTDYDELEQLPGEVKEVLKKIPGAGEVEFEASGRVPMLDVQVNRAALPGTTCTPPKSTRPSPRRWADRPSV